jgi:hypothetical protein
MAQVYWAGVTGRPSSRRFSVSFPGNENACHAIIYPRGPRSHGMGRAMAFFQVVAVDVDGTITAGERICAGELELEQRLQIKPGQSVAVVNAPPESRLSLLTTGGSNPDRADVVIGLAVRPADLAWLRSVYAAARAGRLAWVSYPKSGRPGTDLRRDWLARALRHHGVEAVQDVSITRHLVSAAAAPGQR